MNKYDLGDLVNIQGSPVKYLVHEVVKTTGNMYEYKLLELGTNNYAYYSEYQLSPLGRQIGFDLSDS